VVQDAQSGFSFLAADRLSVAGERLSPASILTSSQKTRVGVFRRCASGRPSSQRRRSRETATGCRGCGYKSASGRREWPNRDPLEEGGGSNLYAFVLNAPIYRIDPFGLADSPLPSIPIPPGYIVPTGPWGTKPANPIWSGNGPPGSPVGSLSPCSEVQKGNKRNMSYYTQGTCPCTGGNINCAKWEECSYTPNAATPKGVTYTWSWVPRHKCAACPEGRYAD
jgi:RHS repeat-associated protein